MHVYCVDKLECDIVCVFGENRPITILYTIFNFNPEVVVTFFVTTCHVCAHA